MGACQMQNQKLMIQCQTWNKDTCELFDYESIDHETQQFVIQNQDSYIINDGDKVKLINETPSKDTVVLLHVTRQNVMIAGMQYQQCNSTALTTKRFPFNLKKNWLTVRSLNKYLLNVGDIFRLGKMTFRVYSICFDEEKDTDIQSTNRGDSNDQCRICLSGAQTHNPLLNACKCCGSLKYVHLECLKRWLRESIVIARSTEKSETYLWKQLKCEICQENFKIIFESNGVTHHLLELLKPRTPHIMLEFHTKKKDHKNLRQLGDYFTSKSDGLIVINMGQVMTLGRAKENWVKLCEVSVSRFHATLEVQNIKGKSEIFLIDNNSKYGTLIQVKEDLPITQDFEVQVGKSLFKLQTCNLFC